MTRADGAAPLSNWPRLRPSRLKTHAAKWRFPKAQVKTDFYLLLCRDTVMAVTYFGDLMSNWLSTVIQTGLFEGWTIHLVVAVVLLYLIIFCGMTLPGILFYAQRCTMTEAEREAEDEEMWDAWH